MHERRLELVDPDAGRQELLVVVVARPPDRLGVGVLAGQQEAHVHSGPGALGHGPAELLVRHEVRAAQVQPLARRLEREPEEGPQRVVFGRRRAGDRDVADRRGRSRPAGRVAGREEVRAHEHLARGARPRLGERHLEAPRRRAGDTHHAVAPLLRVPGPARPLVADGGPAGEAHHAVHDDRPPVIAPVKARQHAEARRPVVGDPRAGALERPQPVAGRLDGSEGVEEEPDLDAPARPVHQGREEPLAHLSVLPDVGEKGHAAPRGADVGQHGGVEGVAVVEQLGRPAGMDRASPSRRRRPGGTAGAPRPAGPAP